MQIMQQEKIKFKRKIGKYLKISANSLIFDDAIRRKSLTLVCNF